MRLQSTVDYSTWIVKRERKLDAYLFMSRARDRERSFQVSKAEPISKTEGFPINMTSDKANRITQMELQSVAQKNHTNPALYSKSSQVTQTTESHYSHTNTSTI